MRAVEMHPRGNDLKAQIGLSLDRAQGRGHQPKLGARSGDKTDFSAGIGHFDVECLKEDLLDFEVFEERARKPLKRLAR
jgi:hypothetical protein